MDKSQDIKTAGNILITEVLCIVVFLVLAPLQNFMVFMAVAVVIISIPVNLFWIIRLMANKPEKYKAYIVLLLLPIVLFVAFIAIFIYMLQNIEC